MKTVIEREYAISVLVELEYERGSDDDGCGSQSRTGNSMTGSRGSSPSVVGTRIVDEAKALEDLRRVIDEDALELLASAQED